MSESSFHQADNRSPVWGKTEIRSKMLKEENIIFIIIAHSELRECLQCLRLQDIEFGRA